MSWFVAPVRRGDSRPRLFCFPHAGGGASTFREWRTALAPAVDVWAVQPPGRESRLRERPFERIDHLVAALVEQIAPVVDQPYAFFGHSMGALTAYELARALHRAGAPTPRHLFLSAFPAPHLAPTRPRIAALPDDELEAQICALDGVPQAVRSHRELFELLLPVIRADLTACEAYRHDGAPPLAIPLTVLGGAHDPKVTSCELSEWSQHTTGRFDMRLLPGGHFYQPDALPTIWSFVRTALCDSESSH